MFKSSENSNVRMGSQLMESNR